MSSRNKLETKKAKLVEKLEAARKDTYTRNGKVVSMRAVSLEIGANGSYYTHLISHPTSFPSSDRLDEIYRAFDRLKQYRAAALAISQQEL